MLKVLILWLIFHHIKGKLWESNSNERVIIMQIRSRVRNSSLSFEHLITQRKSFDFPFKLQFIVWNANSTNISCSRLACSQSAEIISRILHQCLVKNSIIMNFLPSSQGPRFLIITTQIAHLILVKKLEDIIVWISMWKNNSKNWKSQADTWAWLWWWALFLTFLGKCL